MENKTKDIEKNKKVLLTVAILIVIIIVAIVVIATSSVNKFPQVVTISKASLKEVIEVGELSTIEYTYNSYTPVSSTTKDKKGNEKEEIRYYVSYKGNIKAGFDFEALAVNCDNEAKNISIVIPEIKINSIHVDETSLDYIFVKEKYNTENTFQEALRICEKDLEEKANKNTTLTEIAKENAISMMRALLAPWEETLPEGYTIEYK